MSVMPGPHERPASAAPAGVERTRVELDRAAQELARLHSLLEQAIADLMASFHRVSAVSQAQRDLVHALLPDATVRATSSSRVQDAHEELQASRAETEPLGASLARNDAEMREAIDAALTALQFEDIATQLVRHVRRRVVDLHDALGETGGEALAGVRGDATHDADETGLSRTFGPVTQERLHGGTVDLF